MFLQTISSFNGVGPIANVNRLMNERIQQMPLLLEESLYVVEDVEMDTGSQGNHVSLHYKCLYGLLRNESKHEGTGDCMEKYDNIGIMN